MFHDLGISKADFLGAMNATHNRMYLQASVDRKSLARATRTAVFFNVSAEKFELLAACKELRFDACLIEGSIGEIEFSAEHTLRRKSWQTSPAQSSGFSTWEAIFEVESGVVKHQGTVYLESGDKTLELHSVCIFDRSKLYRSDKTPSASPDG
jgi:hypothetical protein